MIESAIRFMAGPRSLFGVGLVECCTKPLRQLYGIIVGPEVHEKQPWLLVQHVTVQCGGLNPIFSQRLDDGIYLFADQNEVSGDCSLAIAGWLKVQRGRESHRSRQ